MKNTLLHRRLIMSNFYIIYYATKHKEIMIRKARFEKPDGTAGKSFTSKQGNPCLIYWDLDADGWRMAVGSMRIKW